MASWDKCRLGLEASNIRNRGLLVENSGLGPKDPWLLFALKFVRSNKCRRLTPIMVKKHTTSKPSIIDSLVCDGTWTIRQSICDVHRRHGWLGCRRINLLRVEFWSAKWNDGFYDRTKSAPIPMSIKTLEVVT